MKRLKLILTIALPLIAVAAHAAAVPDSLKMLGRGVMDREHRAILVLACTGGWDSNAPETWSVEPDCTRGRFVLLSTNVAPQWVGDEIRADKDHPDLSSALQASLKKPLDYSVHALYRRKPNGPWMSLAYRNGEWAAYAATILTIGVVPLLAFSAVPAAIGPWFLLWIAAGGGIDVIGAAGNQATKQLSQGLNAMELSSQVQTVALKEISNRDPRNWSVRPREIDPRAFRLAMNLLTENDFEFSQSMPASLCRFSEIETQFDQSGHFGFLMNEAFFFSRNGAEKRTKMIQHEPRPLYDWYSHSLEKFELYQQRLAEWKKTGIEFIQGYEYSFLDRAKRGPGCLEAHYYGPGGLKPRKNQVCEHTAFFTAKRLFTESVRTKWLLDPQSGNKARFTIGMLPRKKIRFKATVELVGPNGEILQTAEVQAKDAFEVLRRISRQLEPSCGITP